MVTPAAKREAVAHLVETYEVSERRACRLIKGRSDDRSLPFPAAGRWFGARERMRAGGMSASLRLSPSARPAAAGGLHGEPQEDLSALSRGGADWCGAQVAGSARGYAGADPFRAAPTNAGRSTSSTISSRRSALPHPQRDRRRHEGMPGRGRRHLDLWAARRPRTRRAHRRRGKPDEIVSDNGTELTSNAILAWARSAGSPGITSRPASQCKTPSSKASTATCAMNSRMGHCSRSTRRSAALHSIDGPAPRTVAITTREGISNRPNSSRHWIKVGGNVMGIAEL